MLVRNEIILKWTTYAGVLLLCFLIQMLIFQRIEVWGVIPFIYPLLAVIPVMFEPPMTAFIYALALGVICDVFLPGACPCFYTLTFPIAGVFTSLIAQNWLSAGFLCSLISAIIVFTFTGLLHCILLWGTGKAAWSAGAYTAVREFCVTLPFIIPLTPLFRAVYVWTLPEERSPNF